MSRPDTAKLDREVIVQFWAGCYGPGWRWRAAHAPRHSPLALTDDELIVAASQYLQLRARHPVRAEQQYPCVAAADQLQECESVVELLQLLLLAGFSVPEAARRTKLSELQISVWQRLFFDVDFGRDATSWIGLHVIQPMRAIKPLLAVKMKLAYYGGQAVLEEILSAEDAYSQDGATQMRWIRARYGLELEACLEQIEVRRERSPKLVPILMKGWLAAKRLEAKRENLLGQIAELKRQPNVGAFIAANEMLIEDEVQPTQDEHLFYEEDVLEDPGAPEDTEWAA